MGSTLNCERKLRSPKALARRSGRRSLAARAVECAPV